MVAGKIVVSGIPRLQLKIRYPANSNFAKYHSTVNLHYDELRWNEIRLVTNYLYESWNFVRNGLLRIRYELAKKFLGFVILW